MAILAASIAGGYAFYLLFPIYVVVGYIELWLTSKYPAAPGPVLAGVLGTAALAIATSSYIRIHGNWNEPGELWVLFPATGGILLLGVNVFATYLRHLTSKIPALFVGPGLLISSAIAYYWLLSSDSTRADLFMVRADTLFAAMYVLLGIVLVVDRKMASQ